MRDHAGRAGNKDELFAYEAEKKRVNKKVEIAGKDVRIITLEI